MALERKDRVKDQSTTTGTGTLNLDATAPTGFRTFAAAVTSGTTVRYLIESSDSSEWEVGEGVFTNATPDTLSRVTVIASSNSGSLVNFSAGTKTVSLVLTSKDVSDVAPPNLLKNGNFINNSTNGYGSTPDDWTSSNANPVQGGIPALTKQNLIDGLGIADGDIEGLWPLNEASGNAIDLSSNGYNLTDTNTVGASSDGLMASARDFESGSTEYFVIADGSSPNLELTGSRTFIAFVKPESFATNIIISRAGATNAAQLYLETGAKPAVYIAGLTTNTSVVSDVVLQAGKWYMLVGVYDSANSKLKIWVNGIKKEVTASGSSTDTNGASYIGRNDGGNYYDGLIQNACVLSVAITDNQVKKLFAMTMYKGQKIRRATTNGYLYQQLPQDLVERLRGKTVALRADLYQEVASTAQISIHQTMADGTTDETIISATDATTGSWLSKVATGTLEADVVTVEIRIKHSTSDGNSWFRNVSLYEGSVLLPYDHSKDDWSRFPRLLKIDPPHVTSGFKFEENRWFDASTPTYSASGSLTYTSVTTSKNKFMIQGKTFFFETASSGTTGGTASTDIIQSLEGIFSDTTAWVYVGGAGLFDGADMSGYMIRDNTNNGVRFLKYNKANWGLGAARDIRGSGFYGIN